MLDAPERDRVPAGARDGAGRVRGASVTEMPRRREFAGADEFVDDADGFDEAWGRPAARGGVRLRLAAGVVPQTVWGKIAAGCGLLTLVAGAGVGVFVVRGYLLHDEHFVVQGPSSIQIAGNSHLSRPQLLSVFGGDVERSVFRIPLEERRAELEQLPWVDHATVMRLLPNRVRVAIVERAPVAFVRQGTQIGLVDAHGVLLDMAPRSRGDAKGDDGEDPGPALHTYSFPVLTGISGSDPLSTRAARMKIYLAFVAALDAAGEKVSSRLSEVDVSNPEDVKAVLAEGHADPAKQSPDILIHFGDGRFLERYRQYEQHLAEWKTQYPKLASVDMRYERQVVLEMQRGSAGAGVNASAPPAATAVTAPRAADAVAAKAIARTETQPLKPAPLKTEGVKTTPTKTGLGKTEVPAVALRDVPSAGAPAGKSAGAAPPALKAVPVAAVPTPTPAASPMKHLTTAYPVSSGHFTAVPADRDNSAAGSAQPVRKSGAGQGTPQ